MGFSHAAPSGLDSALQASSVLVCNLCMDRPEVRRHLGEGNMDVYRACTLGCETKRVAFRQMSECGSLLKPTHVTDACTSGPSMYEVSTLLI